MRVSIILLDYSRHDYTQKVKSVNLPNAGYPYNLVEVNRKGIAAAFNEGILKSLDYDAVVFMANDILLPINWLKEMVEHAQAIPETGTVGIHTVQYSTDPKIINGKCVNVVDVAFGDVLIPMPVIKKIGGYNTDLDPYSIQDLEFAFRATKNGYIHYYINGLQAEHIGHDVGQKSDYRLMKDEGLKMVDEKWQKWQKIYAESGNYSIPLIEMNQYEGE